MNSEEQCNSAQQELLAFLDQLSIQDADKNQIITLSSHITRLAVKQRAKLSRFGVETASNSFHLSM